MRALHDVYPSIITNKGVTMKSLKERRRGRLIDELKHVCKMCGGIVLMSALVYIPFILFVLYPQG